MKYLSTVYVFVTHPSHSEGALHTARQRIISNKSLFQNASRVGLPAYIQAKPFASKQWHPPNFKLSQTNRVPDSKIIQDTAGDSIEDSQAIVSVGESFMGLPERSSSRHETSVEPTPAQNPKKRSKKLLEDIHWLGDKVTYLASIPQCVRPSLFLSVIGYR